MAIIKNIIPGNDTLSLKMRSLYQFKKSAALTLGETLAATAAIGILASIVVASLSQSVDDVREIKLLSDAKELNSAVKVYVANGGKLTGDETAQEIISKLKTHRNAEEHGQHVGLSESMIDNRLAPIMMSDDEVQSDAPRLNWDGEAMRFTLKNEGQGIKGFYFASPTQVTEEDRNDGIYVYSDQDGWIWEYAETAPLDKLAPTHVPLHSPGGSGSGGSSSSGGGSGGSGSSGSGSGDDGESGSGSGDGSGDDGGGGSSSSGGGSSDGGDDSSGGDDGSGGPDPVQLAAPLISPSNGDHPLNAFPLPVGLTNPNDLNYSKVVYSIDGSPWADYSIATFDVSPLQTVSAKSVTLDPTRYTDSNVVSVLYRAVLDTFSGMGGGHFKNPQGPAGMDVNIQSSGNNSHFEWGEGAYGSPDNSLDFAGQSFSDVTLGEQVQVGTLSYYNGSIWAGTEADSITLEVNLALSEPEQTTLTAEFTFDLENTENTNDPVASADFVRFQSQTSLSQQLINGVRYNITLEFGSSTSQGFTSITQFHVFENQQATAELFATVIAED